MKNYDVDPEKLLQVFDNTTSTYKFYWLRALLQHVREKRFYDEITFTEMVATMVSKAWYPVISGCFSFGKCDELINRIRTLVMFSELNMNDVDDRVRCYINTHKDEPPIMNLVDKMCRYVPFRFLYPWIGTETNTNSAQMSCDFETYRCPYAINNKAIRINPAWIEYLDDHCEFIDSYATIGLQQFLVSKGNSIFMADNDIITADGLSTSFSTQLGMLAEPNFGGSNSSQPNIHQLNILYKNLIQLINSQKNSKSVSMTVNFGPSTQIDNHDKGIVNNNPKTKKKK